MKNKYWFKRKRYGYGFTPVIWQGWLTLLFFIISILGSSYLLFKDVEKKTYTSNVGVFYIVLALSVSVLLFITYKKGPKPKWRWGSKATDNPKKDY